MGTPEASQAVGSAYSVAPGEGTAIWMFDSLDTIKASAADTGGRFTLVEFLDFEGSGPPLHVHEREDRGFHVLEGEYTFFVGDEEFRAVAGTFVHAPRCVSHTWRCETQRGRILDLIVPGGMEDFYREAGELVDDRDRLPPNREPDAARLTEIAAAHGITITGPPPQR